MALLADGDRSACSTAFGLLVPELTRFAERALGSGPDADDAVQLAVEKIFAQASDYDATRPALAWAVSITAWECRTILQRRRRKKEDPIEHAPDVASSTPTPEHEVLNQRMRVALRESFAELSSADRATLEDAYFNDSEGPRSTAFRKRKERALVRLRDAWRRIHGE
jgi:RNA polymerase sigma-70 factor (ECF subfamily)